MYTTLCTLICSSSADLSKLKVEVSNDPFANPLYPTNTHSTIWTTLKASLVSYRHLLLGQRTDLLLCNGPGTCVPLLLGAWLNNLLGLSRTRLLYVESICRVQSLSLSGKILQYFVHDLLVQWPELAIKYPRTKYVARF